MVPDINAEAVAGLAMALSISRGIVISTKKEVDDALIQRDSTDAIHDQAVERTLRANAAVASAAAKIQDHLNRLDRRYGIAVDMQSDASRTARDASDVNNNDRDMRLAVNTANVCLAVCNLKTQAARHAILVANETLREFDALGSAPVLDAQSSGDIEMCEVVDASNMA